MTAAEEVVYRALPDVEMEPIKHGRSQGAVFSRLQAQLPAVVAVWKKKGVEEGIVGPVVGFYVLHCVGCPILALEVDYNVPVHIPLLVSLGENDGHLIAGGEVPRPLVSLRLVLPVMMQHHLKVHLHVELEGALDYLYIGIALMQH